MRVITGGYYLEDPLFLEPMSNDFDFRQLWLFRQPDNNSNNPCFVIMSAYTGLVWHVHGGQKTAGTYMEVYDNVYGDHSEQFYFFSF